MRIPFFTAIAPKSYDPINNRYDCAIRAGVHLKAAYARELSLAVQKEHNVAAVLKYSGIVKRLGCLDLAKKITERALSAEPDNYFAIARLASILRAKGQPQKALAVIDRVPEATQDYHLLTSKAAALCDLDRPREADRAIRRALVMLRRRPKLEATEGLRRAPNSACPPRDSR